jgi:hypothetical protein
MKRYTVQSFARGRSFHVIDETGLPIYDGAPHGKDRPRIFHDEDAAQACADRYNAFSDAPPVTVYYWRVRWISRVTGRDEASDGGPYQSREDAEAAALRAHGELAENGHRAFSPEITESGE